MAKDLNKSVQDNDGRSFIHTVVEGVKGSFGSIENQEMLEWALKEGFDYTLKDSEGLTPVHYAQQQGSGRMISVFRGVIGEEKVREILGEQNDEEMKSDWDTVDYISDSQKYLEQVKMEVESQTLVKPDPIGKFSDDCVVFCEDGEWWDCHMTRVEVGRGKYGDFLFYKMQVIYDEGRDIWILFTRWGRIGEEGAFQKTPYPREECFEQF